jgi:hypothetical protein
VQLIDGLDKEQAAKKLEQFAPNKMVAMQLASMLMSDGVKPDFSTLRTKVGGYQGREQDLASLIEQCAEHTVQMQMAKMQSPQIQGQEKKNDTRTMLQAAVVL